MKNYSNSNANSPSPLNSHYKTNRWSSLNSHTNSLTLRTSSPNMSDMSGMRYTNSPTPTNRNTLVNRNVSTPTQFKRIKLSWNSNYYLKDENDGCICICGCNKCHSLFNVLHTPTNVGFSVGSTCIKKFFPDLYSKVKKIQNKEICIQCNEALYYGNYKGHTKNAEKDNI